MLLWSRLYADATTIDIVRKCLLKIDIFAQIIGIAKDKPVTKTRISYDCFLSYDFLNECLNILLRSGLLGHDKNTNTYAATEKGLHYLELYMTLGR